jgi:hypothetical protein
MGRDDLASLHLASFLISLLLQESIRRMAESRSCLRWARRPRQGREARDVNAWSRLVRSKASKDGADYLDMRRTHAALCSDATAHLEAVLEGSRSQPRGTTRGIDGAPLYTISLLWINIRGAVASKGMGELGASTRFRGGPLHESHYRMAQSAWTGDCHRLCEVRCMFQ